MTTTQDTYPAIAILGGGSGTSTLLPALRELTPDLTSIVTVYDDGGSTGRLRKQHDLPAMGDIRRSLAALSNNSEQAALFDKRLANGHAVGNLVLTRLSQKLGSFGRAVEEAGRILDIQGQVLPVSLASDTRLQMHHYDEVIVGEHAIGTFPITDPEARISLTPGTVTNPEAAAALARADYIILSSGSLYTSLCAVLAPDDMPEILQRAPGKLLAVANLGVEKPHSPHTWHVADHVLVLEEKTGRHIDAVFYNNDITSLPTAVMPLTHEEPPFGRIRGKAIGAPLVGECVVSSDSDVHYVRHNAAAVAAQIDKYIQATRAA